MLPPEFRTFPKPKLAYKPYDFRTSAVGKIMGLRQLQGWCLEEMREMSMGRTSFGITPPPHHNLYKRSLHPQNGGGVWVLSMPSLFLFLRWMTPRSAPS